MRRAYIVSYDIADPKRLRKVAESCEGYGDRIQYSVFRCHMTPREAVELRGQLEAAIHHREDQVLFIDLGLVDGRGQDCITAMGRAYVPPDAGAVVI